MFPIKFSVSINRNINFIFQSLINLIGIKNVSLVTFNTYEIRLGLQKGFDVWYAEPNYEARIMFLARIALLFYPNSDFKSYIEQGFNEEQLELILQGLKEELDITKYAKIEFDESKMKEIMKTLKKNNYENRKN